MVNAGLVFLILLKLLALLTKIIFNIERKVSAGLGEVVPKCQYLLSFFRFLGARLGKIISIYRRFAVVGIKKSPQFVMKSTLTLRHFYGMINSLSFYSLVWGA